jgi:hypothetical protein
MATNRPTPPDAADSRVRGIVTTILAIMLAVMIVRDILVRRWAGPVAADVTYRSSYGSERRSPPAAPDA